MRSLIVGLTGYAGVGKDEAAKCLTRVGWERVSFADPLRRSLYNLNPLIPGMQVEMIRLRDVVDALGWEESKRAYPEIRQLLQRQGTEAGRDIHGQNCWTAIAERSMSDCVLRGRSCVLTDVRFPNEVALVRQYCGIVIRITRPGIGPANAHTSEIPIPDNEIFATIENDGDVTKLYGNLVGTITKWIGQWPAEAV